MPLLRDLLAAAALPIPGAGGDVLIDAVTADSRAVPARSLFVAVPGRHVDGHDHVAAAVRDGAVAVVAERAGHPPLSPDVPVIYVNNSRVALSALAAAVSGHPSRSLTVAGITGTDGKTTTATMLWAAWRGAGFHTGLLSTVDFRAGDSISENSSRQTTMEALDTHRRLASLRDGGCTHVVVETSSHALALHRVDDVAYRVAVYTRITSEHLELHGSRAAYLAAKARLLGLLDGRSDGVAVLDRDDDFAFPTLAALPVANRVTYSLAGTAGADLVADDVRAGSDGVGFVARTPWGDAAVDLRLHGRFNAANALAAIAAACSTGAALGDAVAGIAALDRVPGRMERVDLGQPFTVVIDYAHTAAALEQVLTELRAATTGRLWVVFGSAGDRDREKRPVMGAVAARLADRQVITDEDPREEDSIALCEEIAAGAEAAGARRGETLSVIPDRARAIAFAVSAAQPGDTVLCAGKGHEGSIIRGVTSVPWDERAAVETALRGRSLH